MDVIFKNVVEINMKSFKALVGGSADLNVHNDWKFKFRLDDLK